MVKLPAVLEKYRPAIDEEMRKVLADRDLPLYDMLRYHLGWADTGGRPLKSDAGKALRPTLCLLACRAVGGDLTMALPAAAAIELLHNYSLIHDDIQDDDRERHHRPTVWAVWGKPQAINAGTAMRILANFSLAGLSERGVSLEKQVRVQRLLDEATLRIIEGQYRDISFEDSERVTVQDYLKMISDKTAALIAGALQAGAMLGTEDERLISRFGELGENLGMAFQVRDDILGVWGNHAETGKPLGNDIRRRKKTLPVLYAIENARDGQRARLASAFSQVIIDERSVTRVVEVLDEVYARAAAAEMSDAYCRRAGAALAAMALDPAAKRELGELIAFLADRSF